MDRYIVRNLFGIQGFNIAWYGVIIGCGFLLGLFLAIYRAKKRGYNPDLMWNYFFILVPVAIISARAYYVIFEWDQYRDNLWSVFAVNQGGLAIYGGIIGGVVAAMIYCRVQKFSLFEFADMVIPSLVLGQVVGRWGNFVNQEAFGQLITNPKLQFFPYGVYIEALEEWHQATFFYESTWNLLLFAVMLLITHRLKKRGYLLSLYLVGYGVIRFFIEGLRTDSLYLAPGVRVSQVLSMILVVVGLGLFIYIKKYQKPLPPYDGKYKIQPSEKSE